MKAAMVAGGRLGVYRAFFRHLDGKPLSKKYPVDHVMRVMQTYIPVGSPKVAEYHCSERPGCPKPLNTIAVSGRVARSHWVPLQ